MPRGLLHGEKAGLRGGRGWATIGAGPENRGPAESAEKGNKMKKWWRIYLAPDGGDGGAAGEGAGSQGTGEGQEAGQDAAAQETGREEEHPTARDEEKERRAAWRQTVKDNRDLYSADVQEIVQKRLGKYKTMEADMETMRPMLDMLQRRYGVQSMQELANAVMQDNSLYEAEAARRGMDVETYKLLEQTNAENARLRAQQEAYAQQQAQAEKVSRWRQEEAELKKSIPDFDLDAEMEASGGELFNLLDRGISLDHAYKVLHLDDMLQTTIAGAVNATRQRTLEDVRARGSRARENGAGMSAEKPVKVDIGRMSRAKMEELERRAARGEIITPEKMME